ncbi:cell division cycle and apoptosis regulator protein 1-like [Lingula anatina]|uniref:Cell division cycle and apoptosis regulator protein 1-like n=1 Tax=Lingula anatina TaxID=7574 RepID=A0A2R2MLT1_LINAN|nr:cell division cycle and apoptosis regulator protein 1-like [Lingula anatina]|eukprot:XP_023931165.1 cell division cycle and apoptosis regulator protein 1-like [Lingula anatina]
MAQFGAGKNPPWARPQAGVTVSAGLAATLNQPQVGNPLLGQPGVANPTVYSLGASQASLAQQQFALQQQAAVSQIGQVHPGIAIPTTLATTQVATVSYPTPRAAQQPQPKQRVFTGVVTKLHDNFGFVDEDVFFQTSCVKGHPPKVGDRVLVEASYNANMPFKWNATRIQVLPTQPGGIQQQQQQLPPPQFQPPVPIQGQQTFKQPSVATPNIPPPTITPSITPSVLGPITPSQLSHPPPPLMGQGGLLPPPNHGRFNAPAGRSERGRYDRDRERERDRDRGERERRRSPKRARSRSPRRRSPRRSPPRRRPARIVPRYVVQVPKITLDIKEANVMQLRSRYTNLYIPSDFFNAGFAWADAFPLHRRFQLGNHCIFHVMSKEVEALEPNTAVLEPPDADHLYSAKVMLMSSPTLEELYHKTCALAEDSSEQKESFQHPTRLLSFLVGLKGKSEPMAIGGPWSPSLDGPNPAEDPAVLTRTAIRTTKALTGIDLSACTQWYRFAEIHYHRPEETHKGRVVPARVETVVLFLPDVWSCLPTRLEWEVLQTTYKHQLTDKLAEEAKEEQALIIILLNVHIIHNTQITTFQLVDLRKELEARNLSSKGLKSQLIARLTKALKTEQEKEEQEAESKEAEEEHKKEEEEEKMDTDEKEEEKKKKEDEEKKRREEREKVARERRYTLPESPAILVHPSSVAKSGKFDCTNMSLSVLLDYRPEDNKEHTFEVSLFAELFNEMLMRDFGFSIYKALVVAPERKEEDKEKDKEKKDKDEKHKERSASKEPSSKRRKTDEKDEKEDRKEDEKEKEVKAEVKEEKKEKKEEKKDEIKEEEEEEEEEEDQEKKDKEKKREKVKFYTAYPELLLAFVYFDQNHTGYLLDKDVEEIIHTLGLQLSRAQVRKYVQKLVSRDTLNYRKLTDKPCPKDGLETPVAEGEQTETKKENQTEALDEETMAIGNNIFLIKEKKEPIEKEVRTRSRRGKKEGEQKEEALSADTGMVLYKGSLLDLDSFMQRLEKSEKARVQLETKLKEYQDDMDSLKGSFNSSEQHSQKVVLELQELKKKLRDQTKATNEAETLVKKYHAALDSSKNSLIKTLNEITSALVKQEPSEDKDMANGDK